MGSFRNYDISDCYGILKEVPYTFPGVKDTGETLWIRSQYSKEFRDATDSYQREMSVLRIAGAKLSKEDADERFLRSFAHLVAKWSFDEDCTVDNVTEFLKNNPQMVEKINSVCSNDSLFFKNKKES